MFASTRFLSRLGAFGLFVVVGTSTPTDSTRHAYGYGGIVVVPPAVDVGGDSANQTPDILTQRRIAVRTKNGRVLYANERVTMPASSDDARVPTRVRHPCSQLVQSRAVAAPNS
jgi:hypothetical protein